MKIKLSKSQWEGIGKKAGWMKEACSTCAEHKGKADSGKKDSGKKDWNPNPWAVCHTTVDKKKNPAKYERCVKDVKKKQ